MSNPDTKAITRLLIYAKPYQRQIMGAIACSISLTLFDLAPPYLIGLAVDIVVEGERSFLASLGIRNPATQLLILSLITIFTWGMESLSQYSGDRLWYNLAQSLQHQLRVDTYNHLQELELSFFENQSTGTLLSILNDDINQLERFLNRGAQELIGFFTRVTAVGLSFILLAPKIAWLAILPVFPIIWGTLNFQQRLGDRYNEVRDKAGSISNRLSNNISGIATIKSFTAEAFESERVCLESEAYRRSNRKAIALSVAFIPLIRFLILIGFVTVLYLGGLEVLKGRLSVGLYGFMVFIVQDLLWPFTELSQLTDEYQRAMASVRRVMGLLDSPIIIHSGNRSFPESEIAGEIQIKHLSFAYPERPKIIHDLSMHIPAKSNIGIVGATGSGKSTLVKLLLRFYETNQGEITIDGINIRELFLSDLRRTIGWVSQDVFLFHGTIAENIAYGKFGASLREIVRAAQLAECDDFIQELPYQYDTIVGERGQKLSGGQRQRLAIARAIIKDQPILILDEATSAVDNETEAAIQRSLQVITKNRTTIAITHRLSTIRNCDQIYVMERGKIVEQGQHQELLALEGIYANLWCVQSGIS